LTERTQLLAQIDMEALGERELLCHHGYSAEAIDQMTPQQRVAKIEFHKNDQARKDEEQRAEDEEKCLQELRASRRLIGALALLALLAIVAIVYWRSLR
jgi:hypothetical protein